MRKDEAALAKGLAKALDHAARSEAVLETTLVERAALETAWIKGQAAILAAKISVGDPCPVCGSTDHPLLATSNLPLPDEHSLQAKAREIDELREQRERVRNEASAWEKQVSAMQVEIRLLEESLGELVKKSLTQIDADRKSLKDQLKVADDAGKLATALKQELHETRRPAKSFVREMECRRREKVESLGRSPTG